MPDHWFSEFVRMIGKPVITTSANKVDHNFMTSMEDLDSEIKANVDFAIYEGKKKGRPSQIVHLDEEETSVEER